MAAKAAHATWSEQPVHPTPMYAGGSDLHTLPPATRSLLPATRSPLPTGPEGVKGSRIDDMDPEVGRVKGLPRRSAFRDVALAPTALKNSVISLVAPQRLRTTFATEPPEPGVKSVNNTDAASSGRKRKALLQRKYRAQKKARLAQMQDEFEQMKIKLKRLEAYADLADLEESRERCAMRPLSWSFTATFPECKVLSASPRMKRALGYDPTDQLSWNSCRMHLATQDAKAKFIQQLSSDLEAAYECHGGFVQLTPTSKVLYQRLVFTNVGESWIWVEGYAKLLNEPGSDTMVIQVVERDVDSSYHAGVLLGQSSGVCRHDRSKEIASAPPDSPSQPSPQGMEAAERDAANAILEGSRDKSQHNRPATLPSPLPWHAGVNQGPSGMLGPEIDNTA